MRKKMFIRNVPEHLWDEIDAYCRRRGYKRRDFLAHAMAVMRGPGDARDEEKLLERRALEAKLKAYEDMIKLAKRIRTAWDNVDNLGDVETADNARLEIISMQKTLDKLIKEYIPEHEIPSDSEERKKIGLPEIVYVLQPGITFEERMGVYKQDDYNDNEIFQGEAQRIENDINRNREETLEETSEGEEVEPVKAD